MSLSRRGPQGPVAIANETVVVDGVVSIALSHDKTAFVDECDYPLIAGRRWVATKTTHLWYAKASVYLPCGKRTSLMMHRAIMGLGHGDNTKIDHEDGNGLNNRRSNLRMANTSQNGQNRRKTIKPTSSMYKGVYYAKKTTCSKKWVARIRLPESSRQTYLGNFTTEIEAALAYNHAAIAAFGDFACLNVID